MSPPTLASASSPSGQPSSAVLGLAIKQVIDLGSATLGLLLLSPLLLAVAVAIRLIDGAPVLFIQQRIGLHGRQFSMLKFRTNGPRRGLAQTQTAGAQ